MQSIDTMYRRQASNIPTGSLLFFGDSHIQGLAVTAVSPNAINFGIGHQRLKHLSNNIKDYPNLTHSEKIIIGIGVNDLLNTPEFDSITAIQELLNSLRCCTSKVVFLSVLPVNESKLGKHGANKKILDFNRNLRTVSLNAEATYIELNSSFTDHSNQLSEDYDIGDGLHLNPKGYNVLIELIRIKLQTGTTNDS